MTNEPGTPPSPDRWSIWFSRLVQVFGLVLIGYEAIAENNDRIGLLFVGVACILGPAGLMMLLRGRPL